MSDAKSYAVYHPGTGTLISLDDTVYIVEVSGLDEETLDSLEYGSLDEGDLALMGAKKIDSHTAHAVHGLLESGE